MGNPDQEIKVISECFVRPEQEVAAAKQRCYYLSPLDLGLMSIDPSQGGVLFGYETDSNNNPKPIKIQSFMERLKRSLSIALVHFYPLAGRFETKAYEDEHSCLITVDCLKGPGARLIHATVAVTICDILSSIDLHPAVRSFFDLGERTVNHDGHTKSLLSVQVTELLDGVFIAFTMNHSIVDGTSFFHLFSSLSEIFRSDNIDHGNPIHISHPPVYKMYAPDAYGPIFKLPFLRPEEFITRYNPDPLRERIFHFSPESIARLKAKVKEELLSCGSGVTSSTAQVTTITSFMGLSGLVWRSVTRAQNPQATNDKTTCTLALNTRTRLNPPLSNNYLGNFLGQAKAVCKVGELLGHSFGWAAGYLSQEVNRDNIPQLISESLKKLADRPTVGRPGLGQSESNGAVYGVLIGGSARFDMFGPEFGLGRAVGVRMGYANKDNGKVTALQGREGGGSVDLEICLRPHIMDALEADEEFMSFVSDVSQNLQ